MEVDIRSRYGRTFILQQMHHQEVIWFLCMTAVYGSFKRTQTQDDGDNANLVTEHYSSMFVALIVHKHYNFWLMDLLQLWLEIL